MMDRDNLFEEFHLAAFASYLCFLAKDTNAIKAYREETRDSYSPPGNALDRAIDQATGREFAFFRGFIEWGANQYGRDYLPSNFLDRIAPEKGAGDGK
jgi:hypothetical protein